MTINELIETAHADAKAKGWWDEPRNTGELLMLIVSECGKALEAHRKGKRCKGINSIQWPQDITSSSKELDGSEFCYKDLFEVHVKDTFEDELADIVIRIADLCGWLKLSDVRWNDHERFKVRDDGIYFNTGQALFGIVCDLTSMPSQVDRARTDGNSEPMKKLVDRALQAAWNMAGSTDLWRHVELKLAYNRTRPHKHGKAY